MRNCLLDHSLPAAAMQVSPATAGLHTARRLLSIRIALQLSCAPAPTTNGDILLARYVAGQLPLAAIMPVVWQEASAQ